MSRSEPSRLQFARFLGNYKRGQIDDAPGCAHSKNDCDRLSQGESLVRTEVNRSSWTECSHYFYQYLKMLRVYRKEISAFLVLTLLCTSFDMAQPLVVRYIVDSVLLKVGVSLSARLHLLRLIGIFGAGLILVSNLAAATREYYKNKLNIQVTLNLRRKVLNRLLYVPLDLLHRIKVGGILSRITGDVDATSGLIDTIFVSPTVALLRISFAVSLLVALNWRFAIAVMAVMPVAAGTSLIFAKRIRPVYRSLRKDAEEVDGRLAETFSGIRVVRAFRRERSELLAYMRRRYAIFRKDLFAQGRESILWLCGNAFLGFTSVGIVCVGGYVYLRAGLSIGDLIALQWYTLLLINPIWVIVNSLSQVQRSLAALERVFQVMTMPVDKPDGPDAREAPGTLCELRFENVDFEYEKGIPVIKNFDIAVRCGELIALVGRSGAGKTTITDLVARFLDPTSGRITLNGHDVRDLRLVSYRRLTAVVQQEVFLFDGSVRDNIAYGAPEATDAEIESAARKANAHDFIIRLSNGYDTYVGERGVMLSCGQRQRLAIARAFMTSPQILILDEATSNLDTESEELIQASLHNLLTGRAAFVIAHRLSTVRRATNILVMEKGTIVEQGTHDALMNQRGLYYDMVARQMRFGPEEGLYQSAQLRLHESAVIPARASR